MKTLLPCAVLIVTIFFFTIFFFTSEHFEIFHSYLAANTSYYTTFAFILCAIALTTVFLFFYFRVKYFLNVAIFASIVAVVVVNYANNQAKEYVTFAEKLKQNPKIVCRSNGKSITNESQLPWNIKNGFISVTYANEAFKKEIYDHWEEQDYVLKSEKYSSVVLGYKQCKISS
jgi:hypothetical protein